MGAVGILIFIGGIVAIAWVAKVIADDKNQELKNHVAYGERDRADFEAARRAFDVDQAKLKDERTVIEARIAYAEGIEKAFREGFLPGRKWLSHFVAEGEKMRDEAIAFYP